MESSSPLLLLPYFADVEFTVRLSPVSFQAPAKAKSIVVKSIKKEIEDVSFFMVGDVRVYINSYSSEQRRFEQDNMYDVDNVIKLILDGISGPEGLIFDDCQVQHVSNTWIDNCGDEHFSVQIEYARDEFIKKGNIVFVQIENALCYPARLDKKYVDYIEAIEKMYEYKNKLKKYGWEYERYVQILPCRRAFHKSRVSQFETLTINEFKERIAKI